MKRILSVILFIVTICNGNAQFQVLGNLDLDNKSYQLYFFNLKGKDSKYSISNEVSSFIIEDRKKLKKLKNDWISITKSAEVVECGYDYNIYIVENGKKVVGKLHVNLECGQVVGTGIGNSADFKGNPFSDLTIDNKIYGTVLKSSEMEKFRKLHTLALNTKGVYYPRAKNMDWINYDGQFHMIIGANDTLGSLKKPDMIIKDIKMKFPNEHFNIDFWGYSSNRIDGYIFCNSNFYDKIAKEKPIWSDFKFYIGTGEWEPWSLRDRKRKLNAFIFSGKKRLIKKIKKAANKV